MESPKPLPNPQPSEPVKEEEVAPVPEMSAEDVDALLEKEDPEFVAKVGALEADLAKTNIVLDDLKVHAEGASQSGSSSISPIKKIILAIVRPDKAIKSFLVWLKGGGYKVILKAVVEALKKSVGVIKGFGKLSKRQKLSTLLVVILIVALYFLVRVWNMGVLQNFELGPSFIGSFEEVADHVYDIEEEETMEEFTHSIRQPDYMVLLEKVVVNLKPEQEGTNPMATTQLYVEAASREAAVEIKDRQTEISDLVQRTLEGMTYSELETVKGKNKLKLILRQHINRFLTKGRIRKVYFQMIIIKP